MKNRHFAALLAGVVILTCVTYLVRRVAQEHALMECQNRLRSMAQSLHSQNQLISVAKWNRIATNPDATTCPGCGARYVYAPFQGSTRSVGSSDEPDRGPGLRMIAWCPCAGHQGKRCVLLEGGTVIVLNEAEFQRAFNSGSLVAWSLIFPWVVPSSTSAPATPP